jgi:hypothetical protein
MWFAPIFEAISLSNFQPLASQDPRLVGQEDELKQPMLFACGYAQIVFLCTAFEVFFIWHYANSTNFLVDSGKGALDDLSQLRQWVESRKDLGDWRAWKGHPREKRFRSLTALSFSDLQTASRFFDEIYGQDCFRQALAKNEYRELAKIYQTLQTERNGIVHRGGEHRTGRRIEVPEQSLRERHTLAKWIRDRLLALSKWFKYYWLRTPD